LPAEVLNLIVVFQLLFTKLTWERAKALLLGALLARGKRTVKLEQAISLLTR
jgi:hypothetical protein